MGKFELAAVKVNKQSRVSLKDHVGIYVNQWTLRCNNKRDSNSCFKKSSSCGPGGLNSVPLVQAGTKNKRKFHFTLLTVEEVLKLRINS
jgi:hypothetical protein